MKYSPLKSGDKHLDNLLGGGFRKGLVHLLIGAKKRNIEILLKTAIRALMPKSNGGLGIQKVAYIDGNNRFNPYFLSKMALSHSMNPRDVLSRIYVARAFNWSQMVEIAEVKLAKLNGVGLILLSGITSMFESGSRNQKSLSQKAFNDLKSAINGIKKAISINKPIVIITASKHESSLHKPVGGSNLTHFGCVIIEFIENERNRYTDYVLAQHPFKPHAHVVKWNKISDQIMANYTKWIPEEQKQKDEEKRSQVSAKKNWKDIIELPESNGFVKNVRNLRLKEKRNRTNQKSYRSKSENLTLDYYLKKY